MNGQIDTPLNDYFIPDQIEDTISRLAFYPSLTQNILASGGWDSKVRLWSINYTPSPHPNQPTSINSSLSSTIPHDNPLLSLCWQGETPNLFTSSTDGTIHHIDIQKMQKSLIGKHEASCKEILFIPTLNILLSGGWDGKLNIWDLRSNNPVMSYQFNQKVYTMSCSNSLLVVGLSNRVVAYFNLEKLQQSMFQPEGTCESFLKYQTTKIACFNEGNGYAIGSIEGRVAINYIDLKMTPGLTQNTKSTFGPHDFAFKCHRSEISGQQVNQDVYPINDIAFNKKYGTFGTVGGDGTYLLWDKDNKTKLKKGVIPTKEPLTACDYSFNGDLFSYAIGYDWSFGVMGEGKITPRVGIHYCIDTEKFKKKK